MRITKRTNIAIRVLLFCAVHRDRLVTKAEIAESCNASENHLAQVINQLGQLGFIKTQRGRNGGLKLAREPELIEIGALFREMEAPASAKECFADVDNTCPLTDACRLSEALAEATEAFFLRLDKVTLGTLTCQNSALVNILTPQGCGPQRVLP